MKVKALSIYSKILSFFLVLLGFSSCDSIVPKDEYGTPSAKFKIRGTIVDESDKPIAKIKTVLGMPNRSEFGDHIYYVDSVFTDNEGKFEISTTNLPVRDEFVLRVEDVDGDENGAFEATAETIKFEDSDFTGGTGWNRGEATKDLEHIKLTSVKKD